jgi:Flp pilus assembly protein TadG
MAGDEITALLVILMLLTFMSVTVLTVLRGRQRIAEIEASAAAATRAGGEKEQENALLRNEVGRLRERIATLETIVTDPADRTAREIEALR